MTYAAAIGVCKKAGRWKVALQLVHEMREFGIGANEVAFANAIHACSVAGRCAEALALLSLMDGRESPPPNVVCYNAALGACRGQGVDSLLSVWAQMVAAPGVVPDARSYRTAILVLSEQGYHQEVLALGQDMALGSIAADEACRAALLRARAYLGDANAAFGWGK